MYNKTLDTILSPLVLFVLFSYNKHYKYEIGHIFIIIANV